MISATLHRIMNVPLEAIGKLDNEGVATGLTKIVYDLGLITEQAAKNAEMMNIPILNALNNSVEVMSKALNEGLIKVNQLIDLNFLGLNLGLNPTYKIWDLSGEEMKVYLPLMIIPILAVVTTWFSMKVSLWTAPKRKDR